MAGFGATVRLPPGVFTSHMAADIDHQAAAARRPRFWIAPLVVGCCFSLGYGITHRLMAMQSSVIEIKPEEFVPQQFPGGSLRNLRSRSGDRSPLQVDLAAIDAEAREVAEKNPQPELALQTLTEAPWDAPIPGQSGFDAAVPIVELTPDGGLTPAMESDVIETVETEPAGAVAEPPSLAPLVLVETPFPEPVARPLLETAAPFESELTDDFFLPVVPQAPLPPTP